MFCLPGFPVRKMIIHYYLFMYFFSVFHLITLQFLRKEIWCAASQTYFFLVMKTHLNEKNNVHTKHQKLKQKNKSRDFVTKMCDKNMPLEFLFSLGQEKIYAKNIIV